MNEITRIQAALRPHLPWHGARLRFLALFLVALFRIEKVNLDKLASVFANQAQSASSYKRLTRFFRSFAVDFDDIARAVASWSQIPEPWTLSLDRTNWCFGTVNINILMLGIVYKGVAFPVMWAMLDKRGNSNSDERIDLLERFGRVFPDAQMHGLTGGREFGLGHFIQSETKVIAFSSKSGVVARYSMVCALPWVCNTDIGAVIAARRLSLILAPAVMIPQPMDDSTMG